MAARIYNLFPLLAGPISGWNAHLDRIAAMGFDWVYVNPMWETGGSRSLYAIARYDRLDARVRGEATVSDDELVRAFVAAAKGRGLDVMVDLVINHTANDSPLVSEHPHWYRRDERGELVAPSAVDPDDDDKITVWGDLAELDYHSENVRSEIVEFFSDFVRRYVGLGVRGFRCDAAYQVPASVWSDLIAAARRAGPGVLFAAETLGCSVRQVAALAGADFDLLFNSSKWWDFKSPWLLDQYERFRLVAPSIAFPESHDTPRLRAEVREVAGEPVDAATIEREYRFRYKFAAYFSSGVMMPMGYEYGFVRPLDVVHTTPEDWETPFFDISEFIGRVNAQKASLEVLNEEGAQHLMSEPGALPVLLVREAARSREAALLVVNPSPAALSLGGDIANAALGRGVTLEPEVSVGIAPYDVALYVASGSNYRPRRVATEPPAVPRAVVIEAVTPQVDGGRFPVKRVVGDLVHVEADVFRDGHDAIAGVVRHREAGASQWRETPLELIENDRYGAEFRVDRNVPYEFSIEAWPDAVRSWEHDTIKKRDAGQSIGLELIEGRAIVASTLSHANSAARALIDEALRRFDAAGGDEAARAAILLDHDLIEAAAASADRSRATETPAYGITVDRPLARFGAWYEFFPRSTGTQPGVHGTFADAAARLPAVSKLGFDIVYVPPIHPIGHAFRKGPNNTLGAGPDDPGSPWAIGSEAGGHDAIEPKLGTFEDFEAFMAAARDEALEIAIDYALQCSPDHPYLRDHPEWFIVRPDGTIKHAENPPKKYQDIVNFDWYGPHAPEIWRALRDIVEFWIARGVTIFRVDNPHTKPLEFWEWMIGDVQSRRPDIVFLAEAFTRPKVMARLAKAGFTQSYTYFTWRNTKEELTEYIEELAHSELGEYFRPNFFANTPDILPPILQTGGRAAFVMRLVLAATLSSTYGIYSGYELCENAALPGREEYLDSEKYEIRVRDWNMPGNIEGEIEQINRIRREHVALHDWRNVEFLRSSDPECIAYMRSFEDETLFIVVNLDPHTKRETWLHVPLWRFGLPDDATVVIEDLLGGATVSWYGRDIKLDIDPDVYPAAIYRAAIRLEVARGSVD